MPANILAMTKSEEMMMDIFWSSEKPLTSVDIVNMKVKDSWCNGLVHNIIRALLKKGLLEECGMEHYGTQYARKLKPSYTREEYAAKFLISKMDGKASMSKVIVALAEDEDKEEMIEELESIIRDLRNGDAEQRRES
ncbi:MAG: BlaI/MecI/CopY family transcriptional regulator [Eubacterium sp.]|nr:BlaI/MecI/CopY family transcriptional regulator [Eubacterium sp.]